VTVDCVTPGYAPFQGFDITTNFHEYLKVFDELLVYDFDTFVGGHLTNIGGKKDVEITKEFTYDVYNSVKRIHNNLDQAAVVAKAAKIVGTDNEFASFRPSSTRSPMTPFANYSLDGSIAWQAWMSGCRVMYEPF